MIETKLFDEYKLRRYLVYLPEVDLYNRYIQTLKCILFYEKNEFDKDFQKYLFRKKIHLQSELILRGISLPVLDYVYKDSPIKHCITKYGKKSHIEQFLYHGRIRFCLSATYGDSQLNSARHDDELEKGFELTNILANGEPLNAYLSLKKHLLNDQYIFCMSNEYNENIAREFSSDACLLIKDKIEFFDRIKKATYKDFGISNISICYYDKYELLSTEDLDLYPLSNKDYIFSYQKEYRIFLPPINFEIIKRIGNHYFIEIGNLQDIAEIIYL